MIKNNLIKISMSSLFPLKNRCKFCMSMPKYYYSIRPSGVFQDHEIIQFINNWIVSNIKRMCHDFYLTEMPKNFPNNRSFGHVVDYKGFNPRLHRSSKNCNNTIIDHLSCECGKTSWAFNQTGSKNKPEISQRKARITYSTKFHF